MQAHGEQMRSERSSELQSGRKKGFVWALASIVLVSIAQLLLKYGLLQMPPGFDSATVQLLWSTALIWPVLLPIAAGIGCYGLSVLCWMAALQHLQLSVAYPLLSVSYLIVQVGAATLPVFHESLEPQRVVGIITVMIGIALIMMPDKIATRRRN